MGHIVNPVSFRLGVTKFWKNTGVTLYDSFFKDISSYDSNCTEFIEWFYKSHYLRRKSPFILKSILKVKRRESFFSSVFCNKFESFFNYFLFRNYLKVYLDWYFGLVYKRSFSILGNIGYFKLFNKVLFNSLDGVLKNRSLDLDNISQGSVSFEDYLFVRAKGEGCESNSAQFFTKEEELLNILHKFSGDYSSFFSVLNQKDFSDNDYYNFWIKSVLLDFNGLFSKISLVFDSLRYLTVSIVSEDETESQPSSFLTLLSTPELSHYVIYRSGHYSTKVLLYLSHPLLRSLLKSFEDDWSSVLGFTQEFFYFISDIGTNLIYFNELKTEIILSINLLIFIFKLLPALINFKGFFDCFYKIFFKLLAEEKSEMLSLSNFLQEALEEEVTIFSAYSALKRALFYFSLTAVEIQRSNDWFQKNLSNILAREYEKIWLSLLQKRFSRMLTPNKLVLRAYFIESKVITTRLLFNYFCRHLRQRKPVNTILGMILNELKNQKALIGFKILTAGRFTRRERALYKWQVFQRTPLSLYGSYLDFFCGAYKSRFGVCSFKFWFFKE
jgi:hypothetical protein